MIQEPPELAAFIDSETHVANFDSPALNRIATALEQIALALIDQRAPSVMLQGGSGGFVAPTSNVAPLAALPAVQTVQNTPQCPKHGPDRVKPSSKFAGFYCTAKDETGPRGYCSWQARQG